MKISLQKYPEYKDSGVEWLGEIPRHWAEIKIKINSEIYNGDSLNENKKAKYESEDETHLAYISSKDIDLDTSIISYENGLRIPRNEPKYKVAKSNSSLICIEGGSAGRKIAFTNQDVCFVNKLACISAKNNINSKYLYYTLKGSLFQTQFKLAMSGMIGGVAISSINNFYILVPPLPEQTSIAYFLDRKTALIDKAIGIKQKQIELLKERRQILIHRAVTRGLNPNVKMKDSGVEWIGKIPEGWEVLTKMKFISSLKGRQGWQGLKAEEYKTEGPHVLSSAHFNNYLIDWEKCPRVSLERYLMDEHIQLDIGDILLMKDGANMGKLALVENLPGLACLNSHLLLFRSLNENGVPYYWPKFMFYHMMCQIFQDYVKVNGTGSTFLGISQESIGNYPICLPIIEEQKVISNFLDEQSLKFDKSISLKEQEIEKLKEYKATLINSAVTGKIKVS